MPTSRADAALPGVLIRWRDRRSEPPAPAPADAPGARAEAATPATVPAKPRAARKPVEPAAAPFNDGNHSEDVEVHVETTISVCDEILAERRVLRI